MTANEALVVLFPDVSIKLGLGYSLFTNALLSMGTERHKEIYKVAWAGQVCTCQFMFIYTYLYLPADMIHISENTRILYVRVLIVKYNVASVDNRHVMCTNQFVVYTYIISFS